MVHGLSVPHLFLMSQPISCPLEQDRILGPASPGITSPTCPETRFKSVLAGVSSFLPYLASVSLYTKCRCWSLSPKACEVTWRSPAGCHMRTPHYLIISRSIRCTQPAIGTLLKVEDSLLSGSGTALGSIGFSRMLPLLPFSTFRTDTSIHPGPSPYTYTYA